MKGRLLGNRYEVLEKVGGGGMATVYKARCTFLKRFVAIKMLREEFTSDDDFVKKFRVEAQAAASLSHPNIVSIYDVGQDNNLHYIVMEYIDGITLKEYITQNGSIHWREAVNIAIQICSAIEHAHKNNIVHRDIKPHNILFTKDGIAKVTDFGIARAATATTITIAGNTIGSVHYFSPEQARGGYTDEKSDLYSLGIVLYEMVTGQIPFNGDTPIAVALKHIQADPPIPISINENIPKGVNSIILNAMQKDKNKRYQTSTQMLDDLYKVLKDPDAELRIDNNTEEFETKRVPAVNLEDNKKTEDKGKNKKNNDKLTFGLAIGASFIIITAFIFILFNTVLPALGIIDKASAKEFVLDDYTGRNIFEVKEILASKGVKIKKIIRKYDDNVPKDTIISQNKKKGEKIKTGENSLLEFEVSDGELLIKVPDLKKLDYRQAESELENRGLKSEIIEEYSDTVAVGIVIHTNPEAGAEVKPNTLIKVFKSKGPDTKYTVVPNLVGKTRVEASREIADAKLVIGKVTPEDTSNSLSKITNQEPKAGTKVKEGSAIDLYFEAGGNTDKRVIVKETINLNNPDKYSSKIKVMVEVEYSDTKKTEMIIDSYKRKDEFPFSFFVNVPENGYTKIRVYLDNELYTEFVEAIGGR